MSVLRFLRVRPNRTAPPAIGKRHSLEVFLEGRALASKRETRSPDSRESGPRHWLVTYPRLIPVGIFLIIVALTALSVLTIERGERAREDAAMARTAGAMSAVLERRASVNASYLRAGAALFSAQGSVDPALFNRFVAELRLDADYQGAEGYGWAPVLRPSEVPAFEADLNRYRIGDVRIRPTLAEQPRDRLDCAALERNDSARGGRGHVVLRCRNHRRAHRDRHRGR